MAPARLRPDVLVVGGGIGGLAAALGLLRAGLGVRLLEAAPRFAEVGAGLSLTPNAGRALAFLGLGDWLGAVATPLERQEVFDAETGGLLLAHDRRSAAATLGAPYAVAHRADLVDALVAAISARDPGALVTGAEVTGLAPGRGAVRVMSAHGPPGDAGLVVGADGARSLVRSALFGAESPRFAGHVAWRALVPADRVAHEDLPPRHSRTWTGQGATFVAYRLRGDSLVNLVGLTRRDRWMAEGWRQAAELAEAKAIFARFPAPVGRMLDAVDGPSIASWGLFHRPHAPALASGRVALVGDAGHPMLPFMGQGAAMALEDAVVLARALSGGVTDPVAALAAYDRTRSARTRAIMAASAAGADRIQARRPDTSGNEDALGIFTHDPAAVPLAHPQPVSHPPPVSHPLAQGGPS